MTVTFPLIPTYPSEGWILDEDRALRDLMKGMVVTDQENNQRNVEAWFGHPDLELREQKYPYVTVDLLMVQEAQDRVHRGDLYLADPPDWWGMPPLTGDQVGYLMEMPTPVDLDYQVATWARNPRHDRQLLHQIMTGGRIPFRAGLLWTADGKNRRLDLQGHYKRDHTDENGKRVFNNIFRVRVSSQVPWRESPYPVQRATEITLGSKAIVDRYGGTANENYILTPGTVEGVDIYKRTADVNLDGEVATGVPVTRRLASLAIGDKVAVGKHALTESPTVLSDYRLLVLGLA